jgi:hypothetical protein
MDMRVIAAILAVGMLAAAPSAIGSPAPGGPQDAHARGAGYRCPHGDDDGFRTRRLIGRTLPEAHRVAQRHDCSVRVVKRNGEYLVVTADYLPNRINVGVRHRTVTSIQGVY